MMELVNNKANLISVNVRRSMKGEYVKVVGKRAHIVFLFIALTYLLANLRRPPTVYIIYVERDCILRL